MNKKIRKVVRTLLINKDNIIAIKYAAIEILKYLKEENIKLKIYLDKEHHVLRIKEYIFKMKPRLN